MSATAVVLFNLGAPDRPEAVRPFLGNLFSDPAIIAAPDWIRGSLARFIAWRRAGKARAVYDRLGGGSPLLANTRRQAAALEAALGSGFKVFVAMRYWHPRAVEVAREVKAMAPARVVLLPLYPQFSGTTSGSSLAEWRQAAAAAGIAAPSSFVCCYPEDRDWVAALAETIAPLLDQAAKVGAARLLLSAHGLPRRVVERGDPYQFQVERTARAVVAALGRKGLDWSVCYQSRVGPLRWIEPYAEAELARAGRDRVPVVLAPIAFVSEHSETLVELDRSYRDLALAAGVPLYLRAPAVAEAPTFIRALAGLVRAAVKREGVFCPSGRRLCPDDRAACALRSAA
ncbi:MAG: ferrochelatase [Alphaproteobacteria bacterium]|nr:ferrochelatase [Alphaproteobacteria bacterium]